MASTHIKSGGSWSEANEIYIKQSGIWEEVTTAWYKSGGTWSRVFGNDKVDVEYLVIAGGGAGGGHDQGDPSGGGGGAGGRLIMHFLKSFSKSAQPEQSHYWRGQYSLDGGAAGESSLPAGEAGKGGIVTSGKCFGGYSGPFCEPCPAGTFKYDYSYAICKACENKPANAFYEGIAQASSDCQY